MAVQFDIPRIRAARQFSRRELLRAGSMGLLGLSLPELLAGRCAQQASAATRAASTFGRAKNCIFLCMWGGPAHQDTWDPKPAAPVEYRGEFKPISTDVPGVQICEHFPQLSQRVGKLAIIRSMTHNNADHTSATHFVLTGQPPPTVSGPRAEWPHLGAVMSRLGRGRGALPPFVAMRPKLENTVPRFVEQSRGQGGGWLGSVYNPLTIDHDPNQPDYHVGEFSLPSDLTHERLEDRRHLLAALKDLGHRDEAASEQALPGGEGFDDYQSRAFDLLNSAAAGRAFDLSEESDATRDRYGRNPHGQSVLQARRLIERGVLLVSIYWPNDGIKDVSVYWDTHAKNFIDLRERLMPVADQAFSALLDDLAERGLLDETLIWTGEFGRTPRVGQRNSDAGAASDGRDHWPGCFTSVLAGGGVRGGQVYGASDRYAAYPALNPVAPADLVATAYHCLGVDERQTLADVQGRPQIIRPGKPLVDILS